MKQQKGCILPQVLRHGNEVVGITSWENREELAAYVNGEIARELFRRITLLPPDLLSQLTSGVRRPR